MAHVTLSVPDEVYEEMKRHPEIKWSEVARKSIIEKTTLLRKTVSTKELFSLLPKQTKEEITTVSENEWKEFYKGTKEKKWKRTKYLTQA